jgi:hypothetical protein
MKKRWKKLARDTATLARALGVFLGREGFAWKPL